MLASASASAPTSIRRGARRGDRRRGTGRAGGRRLRRVRGAGRAGPREHRARRAGRHRARASRTTSASRPASPARRSPGARSPRRRSSAPRSPSAAPSPASTATAGPTACISSDGQVVRTRAIVIATGAKYRKLDLPSLARFEGAGVYYCATYLEAQLCHGEEIAIVGGGNSAGPGGGVPAGRRHARAHAGARPRPGGEHVALLDPAHREHAERRAAHAHAGRSAGGRRRPRARALAAPRHRRAGDARDPATCS